MVSKNNPALKPLPEMSESDSALLYDDFLGLEYKIDHQPQIYDNQKKILMKVVHFSMGAMFVTGVIASLSKIGAISTTSVLEGVFWNGCAIAPSGIVFATSFYHAARSMQTSRILTRLQNTYGITPTVTIDPVIGQMKSDFSSGKIAARKMGCEILAALFRDRRFLER